MTQDKVQAPKKEEKIISNEASLTPEEDDNPKGIGKKFGSFDAQGIIISLIVSLVAVFAMNTFIVPVPSMAKYKADITRLENDLVAIREVDKGLIERINVQDAKVSSAVNGVPATVDSRLTGFANKSSLDAIQVSVNNLSEKVSEYNGIQTTISNTTSEIGAIKTSIESIKVSLSNLANSTEIKAINTKITAIEEKIKVLETQTAASTLSVSSNVSIVSIRNVIPITVPVTVTNSGTTSVTTTLKLTLTTATPNIIVTDATMNRTFTRNIVSPNITFLTDITVEAGSSVTINPTITLTYTGTSPNDWNVTWSKN